MLKNVKAERILSYSGCEKHHHNKVKTIKKHQYQVWQPYAISGAAPKACLRIYEYGSCKKSMPKNGQYTLPKSDINGIP